MFMTMGRGAITVGLAAALVCSVTVSAQNDKKRSDAQKREIQAIVKILDEIAAGKPAPNDLMLTWQREDLLKAQGNKQYVPFTVSVDPSKASENLTVYWRVVAQSPAAETTPQADARTDRDKDKDKKDSKTPEYAYEDMTTAKVSAQQGGRISRSFTVGPGAHDVYVVVKEPTSDKRNAPAPKTSVIKQTVEVPDLWNGELNTSSVIVAERIDPLPAPLTPQQMAERPYALGTMEIVPVAKNSFPKQAELSTFLLIYNARTDSGNKPDVNVEYNFYAKQAGAEKFFNKTNPQPLNATTLPADFDFAAGHQLQSGQAVPLTSFPEGEYRLEIKVTDKLANKTLTRDVNFSVTGS